MNFAIILIAHDKMSNPELLPTCIVGNPKNVHLYKGLLRIFPVTSFAFLHASYENCRFGQFSPNECNYR